MCGARPPTLQHYHGMNVMHRDKSIPFWKLCIKYNLTSKHTNSLNDTCHMHRFTHIQLQWTFVSSLLFKQNKYTKGLHFLQVTFHPSCPRHVWQWLRGQINWRRLWAGNHFLKSMSFESLTLMDTLRSASKLNHCGLVSVIKRLWMFSGSTRHLVLQNEYNMLTVFCFLCQMVQVAAVLDTECLWTVSLLRNIANCCEVKQHQLIRVYDMQ